MKQRICLFFLAVAVAVAFCACSTASASESTSAFDFSKLVGDDGYVYPGLPWGTSIKEVEKAVDVSFVDGNGKTEPGAGEAPFAERESAILYPATDEKRYIEFCGGTGEISYQFFTGGLAGVGVSYLKGSKAKPDNEDLVKLQSEMLGKLTEALGEPADDQTKDFTFGKNTSTIRTREWSWESAKVPGQTTCVRLVTSTAKGKSEPGSLEFNVSRFIKKADQPAG